MGYDLLVDERGHIIAVSANRLLETKLRYVSGVDDPLIEKIINSLADSISVDRRFGDNIFETRDQDGDYYRAEEFVVEHIAKNTIQAMRVRTETGSVDYVVSRSILGGGASFATVGEFAEQLFEAYTGFYPLIKDRSLIKVHGADGSEPQLVLK